MSRSRLSRHPALVRRDGAALAVALVLVPVLVGCAAYRSEPRRTPEQASRSVAPPPEPLDFERALALLLERNPELRALEAEARGVNVRPNEAALGAGIEVEGDGVDKAAIGTDLLSLFGIGPRPAQAALARAMRSEVRARRLERARELARDLAIAYARLGELGGLVTSVEPLDVGRYERAGLVAPSDVLESGAARIGWTSEREIVALEARRQRLAIARLIGAGPEHEVVAVPPVGAWPAVPEPEAQALLYARADLQRLAVAVEVADREARLALARQIPNVGLALGAVFDPTDPWGALEVSVPLGAASEARAALARRDAAVLSLEAGVLEARHDAAERRLALEEADAELRFWQGWWTAKRGLVQAARARSLVDPREITMAVHLENEEVEAARDLREALLHRADARVEAALAAGWPGPRTTTNKVCAALLGQMQESR